MPHISNEEAARIAVDGAKDASKGSPIVNVLLLIALSIGAAFLKSYLESIRETRPFQFTLILAMLILLIIFAVGMVISK